MSAQGVERGLATVVPQERVYALGVVTAIEAHADLGWLATITLQPGGGEVQARIAQIGTAAAGGMFFPVAVDDEVEVYFPDGDPNRAVCRAGLVSAGATAPSCYDNSTPQLVHANGMEFRTGENATVQPVVVEALLPDLLTWVAGVASGLAAFGIATDTNLPTNLPTAYRSAAIQTE